MNLFSLAFEQFKSIGSGICYPLENFYEKTLNHLKLKDRTAQISVTRKSNLPSIYFFLPMFCLYFREKGL